MISYSIELEKDDNGTFLVTCPDLPEVTTFGETIDESLAMGSRAVAEALAARLSRFDEIPAPKAKGKFAVAMDMQLTIKVLLRGALQNSGRTRADLQRNMKVHRPQVDRLFDPNYAGRLEQYEAAFAALGKQLTVKIADMA